MQVNSSIIKLADFNVRKDKSTLFCNNDFLDNIMGVGNKNKDDIVSMETNCTLLCVIKRVK